MRRWLLVACLVVGTALSVDAAPFRLFPLVFGAAISDRVQITSTAAISDLTTWTVVALVNQTTAGARIIFGKGDAGTNTRRIVLRTFGSTGQVNTFVDGSTDLNYNTTNNVIPTLNQWVWLAAVCDLSAGAGLKMKYYSATASPMSAWVSQPVTVTAEGAGYLSDAGKTMNIGNLSDNAGAWIGSIAYAALSSQALTLDEIEGVRRNWSSGRFRGALGAWVPGANGTGPVFDLTGNGNVGTITGAIPNGRSLPRVAWQR